MNKKQIKINSKAKGENKEFEELKLLKELEESFEKSFKEEERMREILDRIPTIQAGEKYIQMKYPIRILLARSNIQVLAVQNIGRKLSESEIKELEAMFFEINQDAFSDICAGTIDAICEITGEKRKNDYYAIDI